MSSPPQKSARNVRLPPVQRNMPPSNGGSVLGGPRMHYTSMYAGLASHQTDYDARRLMSAQPFKPVSTTYMGPFKHSNVGISPTSAMYHNGNYSPIKTAALTRVALGSRPMTFDASMLTGSMASTASLDDNASMLSSSRMSEYRRQFGARSHPRPPMGMGLRSEEFIGVGQYPSLLLPR